MPSPYAGLLAGGASLPLLLSLMGSQKPNTGPLPNAAPSLPMTSGVTASGGGGAGGGAVPGAIMPGQQQGGNSMAQLLPLLSMLKNSGSQGGGGGGAGKLGGLLGKGGGDAIPGGIGAVAPNALTMMGGGVVPGFD